MAAFRDTWKKDRWVRPYLTHYRRIFVLAVALSVIAYVFAAALMFTSGYMISLAATIPFTVLALHIPSIFVRIFGVGKPIIQYFERLASHDWVLRMTSSLRERLYVAVEKAGSSSLGRMLGLFASDIEHVQDLYLRTIFPLITMLAMYAIIVIAMGVFSWSMALVLLIAVGITAFVLPLWSLLVNGARVANRQAISRELYDSLTEDVVGIADWRLSGREDDFIAHATCLFEKRHEEASAMRRFERRSAIIRQTVFAVAISLLFIWVAFAFGATDGFAKTWAVEMLGVATMHDSLPYAANWIAAFVLCAFPLLEVFAPASEAVLGFAKHESSVENLNEIDGAEDGASRGRDSGLPEFNIDAAEFLDTIKPGEHIAIIGKSGAGKTTLLRQFYSRLESKGFQVGLIEQSPYVFAKSLRENLLLADPYADDERLMNAIRQVKLDNLVERFPDGLDTKMAEAGTTLSGGERHRLALARILLAKAEVVLLDEPYKGLDSKTEQDVSSVIFEVFKGKTLFVVTHNLQGIDLYDRVVMIEDGKIIADDAPGVLASKNSRFGALMAFEQAAKNFPPKTIVVYNGQAENAGC